MSGSGTRRECQSPDDDMASERGLSAKALKWIAMATMLIDHAATAVVLPLYGFGYYPGYPLEQLYEAMRIVGRLAFPLFVYLIVDSFFFTRNRKRFVTGLLVFALISEIPFDVAITLPYWEKSGTMPELFALQNIYFTLLIGVLCLMLSEYVFHGASAFVSEGKVQIDRKRGRDESPDRPLALNLLLVALITAAGCALAYLLNVDYGIYGVLAIVFAYLIRKTGKRRLEIFGIVLPLAFSSIYELFALLDGFVILAANGKRGNIRNKWLYYIFYPAHLALLAEIKIIILRQSMLFL
jgi:hypothetical protein